VWAFSSCAPVSIRETPPPPEEPLPSTSEETLPSPPEKEALDRTEPVETPEGPSPRAVASLRLTDHARLLIETGQPDEAIRTLERAINLNPSHGQNYYYLSEAWLMKRNFSQAEEFNRLAAIYLKDDPEWMGRVIEQRTRISSRRK